MLHKFQVGQRCYLLQPPGDADNRYRDYIGAVVTITELYGMDPYTNMPRYRVDKPGKYRDGSPTGLPLHVSEKYLKRLDDKWSELGSWDEIAKLLGTDIRKEPVALAVQRPSTRKTSK